MYTVPGCKIHTRLYESSASLVFRGIREVDNLPVVLKILKEDYPSMEELVRYRQEYEITRSLELPGVIKAYAQEKYGNTLAIILEDFGGESLKIHRERRRFTITEIINLTIRISIILGEIHDAKVIHKDINPSNIVYNPESDLVKIIDFGLSSRLSRETPELNHPERLEGTLAYMSPEQTGRMNRTLDYRTDFYALGVTVYELLTERLPFQSQDLMELTHCHLARKPNAPKDINPEIPQSLSLIVLKLLAKRAEDRYQTIRGLVADLEFCLKELEAKKLDGTFTPGQQDVSSHFQLPQKLYGRDKELELLLKLAERAAEGPSQALFVAGYSGVGKSALIKNLYKTLIRPGNRNGYFITGKFEQYHRDIPYSALKNAFKDLTRQLLTESEEILLVWKERILAALGPNGRVMIDFLPELKHITGIQPQVPELDATANRNRFTQVVQSFINVFLSQDHNLVFFLDDLQWADLASLDLIQLITSKSDFLFFIGAFRNNEVTPGHPLNATLDEIRKAGTPLNIISLTPLELPHVREYLADATRRKAGDINDLAELIKHKTNGNPFFMGEFLRSMIRDNLLTFDLGNENWFWDIKAIQEQNISDNVVKLVAERINVLEPDTRAVLTRAACLGNTFDLETLAQIHDKSPAETAGDLWPALELNMVLPLRFDYKIAALDSLDIRQPPVDTPEKTQFLYKFGHDRIAEASYNLISELERQELHLKAGRILSHESHNVFEIVDHMNLGRALIKKQPEKDRLAKLNLRAGLRARASTAYAPALNYYKTGLELLQVKGKSTWQRDYQLTFDLNIKAAEAALLSRDFTQMKGLLDIVLENSLNILDSAKVYELQIQAYIAQNKLAMAVKTALLALRKLGVNLPEKPGKHHFILGLLQTKLRLARKSTDDILSLPAMQNPRALAASRVLEKVASAAYSSVPGLVPLIAFQQIKISLKYGNAPETPSRYMLYGIILSGVLGDVKNGTKYSEFALRLMDKLDVTESRAKNMFIYYHMTRHWKKPLQESIEPLLEVHRTALEIGDLEFSALSLHASGVCALYSGCELGQFEKDLTLRAKVINELGQKTVLQYLGFNRQIVEQLREYGNQPTVLSGSFYDEKIMLPIHEKAGDKTALFGVHFRKLMLSCIFQVSPPEAVRNADYAQKYLGAALGSPDLTACVFYDSLARLAGFSGQTKGEQKRSLKKIISNQKKIKNWAQYAPMNQLHRLYLVKAELARVQNRPAEAVELYNQAIEAAHDNDYLHDEALTWELAGRFYLSQGPDFLARFFLDNARYAYSRWGAVSKVIHLEKTYPEILTTSKKLTSINTTQQNSQNEVNSSGFTSMSLASSSLDLSTIIKASQAISSEIVLDSLLHNMMQLLMENAGAEKGFFLLEKSGELYLEAHEEVSPEGGYIARDTNNAEPIKDDSKLPLSLLDYTMRTGEVLVLPNAREQGDFTRSKYIQKQQVLSILSVPIKKRGRTIGILYMENNLTPGAFTAEQVEMIEILAAQIDLSLENARLYANLEEKVKERTAQLETALGDVNRLKTRQDGDYFLTSVLLKPLCENTASDERIKSDILIKQYKQFQYDKWNAEIGGDMCACHDLTLRGKTYTLFLNADAMGKSMQGAGGSLVLLAALKALLGKVNARLLLQNQSPEAWLANAYMELHQIFVVFNGFMQVTLIMGLADGENKRLYYINGEHPRPVLFREGKAEYFGPEFSAIKLGQQMDDPPLSIETLALETGDIILLGSDGKDDLQTGLDDDGNRIIHSHKDVFLECVLEAGGEPEQIMEYLEKRGDFIDDFSLLRLRVT